MRRRKQLAVKAEDRYLEHQDARVAEKVRNPQSLEKKGWLRQRIYARMIFEWCARKYEEGNNY